MAATCEAPGCAEELVPAGQGRPARFCSAACRVRAHRHRQRLAALPVTAEVDFGSARSRGRPRERASMVRLRRGERSVIVAIGLRRTAADRLAESLTELFGDAAPGSG